jgi:hypothetical protein
MKEDLLSDKDNNQLLTIQAFNNNFYLSMKEGKRVDFL